jgi:hypothetical protein
MSTNPIMCNSWKGFWSRIWIKVYCHPGRTRAQFLKRNESSSWSCTGLNFEYCSLLLIIIRPFLQKNPYIITQVKHLFIVHDQAYGRIRCWFYYFSRPFAFDLNRVRSEKVSGNRAWYLRRKFISAQFVCKWVSCKLGNPLGKGWSI